MSYNFSAEKHGEQNLQLLHELLSAIELLEFFPVVISGSEVVLGISIPFKTMDDPRFETELEKAMVHLVSDGFEVTDLFTGKAIVLDEIPKLARQISA
ncbi:hypothetical protein NHH03_10415 [Stieleria sp. TO1_6]|uniref:hypothetical protein n=1 Tax=Stieleria tagensis TaxID=2956795 RepID=UPI00209AD29F|nr:hypothetical protein [Stieleria tagensis]MCO8122151.1 hypothetical protein [Stieleria tagensis]